MIKVENLKLSFGKNEVLKGINFKIEKGMIVTALARDYLKRQKIEIIE